MTHSAGRLLQQPYIANVGVTLEASEQISSCGCKYEDKIYGYLFRTMLMIKDVTNSGMLNDADNLLQYLLNMKLEFLETIEG